jgi:hypothetical protein
MTLSDKLKRVMRQYDPAQTSVLAQIVNMIPELVPTPKPTMEPTPEPQKSKEFYVLKRTDGESIATVSANVNESIHVALWNDLLLYPEKSATQGAIIQAKNINTGNVQTLFIESDYRESRDTGELNLSSFDIVDDSLVFSLTGYLVDGAQYAIDLDPVSKVQKIASIMSGNFVADWHDRTWIIGGFGDGCAGWEELYSVDRKSWNTKLVVKFNINCDTGERIIGIDKKERLLLAGYTANLQSDQNNQPLYSYVTSVYIDNPTFYEGVIATQTMPPNVSTVFYDPEINSLVLSSKTESTIYSLTTDQATKSATIIPAKEPDAPKSVIDIKKRIKDMKLPEGMEWEVEMKLE